MMRFMAVNVKIILLVGCMVLSCHSLPGRKTGKSANEDLAETRFLMSDEEPGILLPPDDKYNFVGQSDPTTPEMNWRTGKQSRDTDPQSSNHIFKPKPIPMTVISRKDLTQTPSDKNKEESTVFVKNTCYGPRCSERNLANGNDPWKSYKLRLKDVYEKQRRLDDNVVSRNDFGPVIHQSSLSVPFRVGPAVPKYELGYLNKLSKRVLGTTPPPVQTSTSGWLKLQPILPDQYDPFTFRTSNKSYKVQASSGQNSFANRLGVELNPESFAARWGWSDQKPPGGSRYPSWLDGGGGGDNRNSEDRNWVKLEAIPVAGVSISKWVPKGTPGSELPSTNWPSRDKVQGGNGFGHSQPNSPPIGTKWWDVIDHINRVNQNRPNNRPSDIYDGPPKGWSLNKSGPSYTPSWDRDRDRIPQNSWEDVIYPNGPGSATASWQKDRDMSKYPSSFPIQPSGSSWSSDNRRPSSSNIGTWSSDRNGNRRQDYYQDRNKNEDDPRWVLVSNTKKVTVSAESNRKPSSYDGVRYRPQFDRFSDFPYHENSYSHRRGKNYRDIVKVTNITITKPGAFDQDEAFRKVNATLANLTPVLGKKKGQQNKIPNSNKGTTGLKSKLPGFLKPYFGDGRGNDNDKDTAGDYEYDVTTAPAPNKVKNTGTGLRINPVYAAVGAGMIPAAAGAILPMVLGRRKRDVVLLPRRDPEEYLVDKKNTKSKPPLFPILSQWNSKNLYSSPLIFSTKRNNFIPPKIRSM